MGASTGEHPGLLEVEAARRAIGIVAGLGPQRCDASPMPPLKSERAVDRMTGRESIRISVQLSAERVTPPGPYSPSVV